MLPRPRFRLPVWAALIIPAAAYIVRGLIVRGGDMRPDLPSDAVVGAAIVLVVALVAFVRSRDEREDG